MKLRQQILTIVAIPLIGIVSVSGIGLYGSVQEIKQTNHIETALDYADIVSALVHDLQIERGYSAGFVGSKGANFGDVLVEQRKKVDEEVEIFAGLHDVIALDYPDLLSTFEHDLEELGTMRQRISSLTVGVPELASLYTHMIKDALTITDVTFADIHLGTIALAGASYVSLSEGKEAAGQERAFGAAGFASGEFSADQLRKFFEAGGKQAFALYQSELYSREAIDGLQFSEFPESAAITELRALVASGGDLSGVSSLDWFATSSEWIERLRAVELQLLEGIHVLNKQEAKIGQLHAVIFAAAAALSLIVSVFVAFLMSNRFNRQVHLLNDAMTSVARKEFGVEISTTKEKSEIGDLSRALDVMRNDLKAADDKLMESFSKSFAFDDSNSAMMIVNPEMEVLFTNKASKEMLNEHVEEFRGVWPDFDANSVDGNSIDRFHANPSHQRAILSDPSRLPWRTDISIGDLKFELNASYVKAEDGGYAGNILQWREVTQERMHAGVISAMDQEQCIVEYNLDGCVIKANDRFLNMVHLSASEVDGRHHQSFLSDKEPTLENQEEVWAALNEGQPQYAKLRLASQNDASLWLRANLTPIVDQSGKAFKVVMMGMDISTSENARITAESERLTDDQARDTVVQALASSLNKLSEGDLTCQISSQFEGDYERLRVDFNNAVGRLSQLIRNVDDTVTGVSGNASEVSEASGDLARRTENQAATLEETAAALEELTATVKSTAENANNADAAVVEARSEAEAGGGTVREVVDAMQRIAESSDKVAKIMAVIDDIAFQTNLLALNAGVEAARAGESGRGFSVVASEVRALAQRASDSAKEISELITISDTQVRAGVELVEKAGEALEKIVASVSSTGELVGTITHAAQEQATALQEINTAVATMDQTTQHNAAMVEETTAVSTSLSADADELRKMIAAFRTMSADVAEETEDQQQNFA
ncbi:MAG: methyl-accepting chemotaxis protein [Roseobacter sp.]